MQVGTVLAMHDAVAVLVLQAFARERRAAGRAAAQEALAARVGERPDGVAHALESEHRVVDEERNHLHAVIRVRGAGGRERRHGAGLGDAFFQDLAVLRFLVVQEHFGVVRFVELPLAGVNAELAEQRLHAERARLVGDDRDDALADLRVLHQQRQHADESHRAGDFAPARAFERFLEVLERRRLDAAGGDCAAGM